MKIIRLPISQITPYDKNAKRHTDIQIQHIANSIDRFGFNDPIGIWGDSNTIIEGHGRYLAQKKRGETEIDCIRLDHLSDEDRRAYTLVHNQTTVETGFDIDALTNELSEISAIDMDGFGFDMSILDDPIPVDLSENKTKQSTGEICACPKCGFEFEAKK